MKRLRNLNQRGFSHHALVPILVIVLVAMVGMRVLPALRAETLPKQTTKTISNPSGVVSNTKANYAGFIGLTNPTDTIKAVVAEWIQPTLDCTDGKDSTLIIAAGLGATKPSATFGQGDFVYTIDGCHNGSSIGAKAYSCQSTKALPNCMSTEQEYANMSISPGHLYVVNVDPAIRVGSGRYDFYLSDYTTNKAVPHTPKTCGLCSNGSAWAVVTSNGHRLSQIADNGGKILWPLADEITLPNNFIGIVDSNHNSLKVTSIKDTGLSQTTCAQPSVWDSTNRSFSIIFESHC